MRNPRRIHLPGGTYYVFRRSDSRYPLFSEPEDYRRFDDLLAVALEASGAKLLGYCWLPAALHMVVEIGDRPIAEFMRSLMWRHSRDNSQRAGESRPWFRERYRATLVQPDCYLEALIRHVHYLPIRHMLVQHLDDYPYSSHHTYLGLRSRAPIHCRPLLRMLGCSSLDRSSYRQAMAEQPPDAFVKLFEQGLDETPGIVGDQRFASALAIATPARRPVSSFRNLDRLIAQIAERNDISLTELCSRSRRRELVIARAQITWFAILWNLGNLNHVAARLHHSPSALSRAAARYSRNRPELFKTEALSPSRSPIGIHTTSAVA